MINKEAIFKLMAEITTMFDTLVYALDSDNNNAIEKIFHRTATQMKDVAFKNSRMINVNYSENTMLQAMMIQIVTNQGFDLLASIEDLELLPESLAVRSGLVYIEIQYDDISLIERISTFDSDFSEFIRNPDENNILRTIIYKKEEEGGEMINVQL